MILDWLINIWLVLGCVAGILLLIVAFVAILSVFKDM